jgi:hypothetical protein
MVRLSKKHQEIYCANFPMGIMVMCLYNKFKFTLGFFCKAFCAKILNVRAKFWYTYF